MSDIPSPNEEYERLPDLDINQYDQWRDWLFNLQLGHTELKGEKDSYLFGNAAHIIGMSTILELRESRKKNGQPYIICTDEKTDEQVLLEAPKKDREEAFINAAFKQARGWISGETQEEKQYYPTAVLALGSALLEINPQNVKEKILEKIEGSNILPAYKDPFKKALNQTSERIVTKFIDYLKFSQTQMTNDETYFIRTGLKEPPPLGSAPLVLDAQTFEFQGQDFGGIPLTKEDEDILIPLLEANHRSRQEMVEQAKENVRQLFNKPVNDIHNPPLWWLNSEDLNALSSKQVLIYAPNPGGDTTDKLPKVFNEIYKSSHESGGWFLIEVQKQKGPWLLSGNITRLVN